MLTTVNPSIDSAIKKFKGYIEQSDGHRTDAHCRISRNQAWSLYYIAKKEGLQRGKVVGFTKETSYPSSFQIGVREDGSPAFAEIFKDKINGPFWIKYTLNYNLNGKNQPLTWKTYL